MKKIFWMVITIIFVLKAQTLFEIKDESDNTVFSISNDGLRVFSYPDTLMIISASEIRANLANSKDRALSRSFSISTNTTGKAGLTNVLEVTASDAHMHSLDVTSDNATMSSTAKGPRFSYFSPENIFLGLSAGVATTGTDNVFLGNESGLLNESGYGNIFVGHQTGYSNTIGYRNTFLGSSAGHNNDSGDLNVFVGFESGYSNTSNGGNVYLGYKTGYSSSGLGNIFIGQETGRNLTTGDNNCFMGIHSGVGQSTGYNNVYLGAFSGSSATGSNNIFIGFQAGMSETGSSKLYIDNTSTSSPLIHGDFDTNTLTINGNMNIINSSNTVGQKGLVIDTDGESTDIPLRIRTTSTASGWTDADTKFVVQGDGKIGLGTTSLSHRLEVQDNVVGPMTRFQNLGNDYSRHGIRIDTGAYSLAGDHWLIRCFTGDGSLYAGSIKSRDGVMSFDSPSDIRLKKNISTSSFNALKMLMNLRIVDYQWKTSKDSDKYVRGYIAQEAKEVLPEMVSTDPESGYHGISTDYLIPILHKGIQEQQSIIENQQKMIKLLEERIEKLENK